MVKKDQLDECLFIIFGITGDLAKRKLIPAIYKLIASGKLRHFALVGTSITQTTIKNVLESARAFIPDIDQTIWKQLHGASYYYQMDFHDIPAYDQLHK